MRRMSRSAVVFALAALAGCHLADSPDAVECEAGQHPSDGHCVLDDVVAARVTIQPGDAGGTCTLSADSIKVAPNGKFEFLNSDTVDHVIVGADGQTWTTVKAGLLSPLVTITKAGSWPYTVSGCADGGTIVVE